MLTLHLESNMTIKAIIYPETFSYKVNVQYVIKKYPLPPQKKNETYLKLLRTIKLDAKSKEDKAKFKNMPKKIFQMWNGSNEYCWR